MIERASLTLGIPKRTEATFCVFLLQIYPEGTKISYEAEPFTRKNEKGEDESTIPDYKIIKPSGKTIYIEITKDRKNGSDPKERERKIMKQAAPDSPYIVLYCDALKRIQKKHRGFDFFKKEWKHKKLLEENKMSVAGQK